MPCRVPFEATMEAYGGLRTDRRAYRPLDRAVVRIVGRGRREDSSCHYVVFGDRVCGLGEARVLCSRD